MNGRSRCPLHTNRFPVVEMIVTIDDFSAHIAAFCAASACHLVASLFLVELVFTLWALSVWMNEMLYPRSLHLAYRTNASVIASSIVCFRSKTLSLAASSQDIGI